MPSAVEISAWRPTLTPETAQPERRIDRGVKAVQFAQAAIQHHPHGALVPIAQRSNRHDAGGLARQQPAQTRRSAAWSRPGTARWRGSPAEKRSRRPPARSMPESNTFKVLASSQSMSMKAGNVGRKNSTDTADGRHRKQSGQRPRFRAETCGRGGRVSAI